MSDPKTDHETPAADVAIAAQTTLDAAQAAEDVVATDEGGAEQIHLIMGALEKLASATDQMAQQLSERLDVVREGFTEDLDAARSRMDETQRENQIGRAHV